MSQPSRQSQEFLEAWAICVGSQRKNKRIQDFVWFNQGPSAEEEEVNLVEVDPQAYDAEPVQVVEEEE